MALPVRKTSVNVKGARVEVDLERLSEIRKTLRSPLAARVGILGAKTNRAKSGPMTNAAIGAIHEFGSPSRNIPRRSFLKDTFALQGKKLLGIKAELWKWFSGGKATPERLRQTYAALGHRGEVLVQEAFETGGSGRWATLKPATIRRKGSSAILIDTAQLRRSITSDVVKG